MPFDWPSFLSSRNIPFSTSGPNVARGNITTHCPFCGTEDEGHHLSISTEGAGWRCWRRPAVHKGKSAARLVMSLIGCSHDVAASIVGSSTYLPDDFLAQVSRQLTPVTIQSNKPKLTLPKEFISFDRSLPSGKLYRQYLMRRSYISEQISRLTEDYEILYCNRGPFKGRIIFPVYHDNKLVTWTGRTIFPSQDLRYKTLSPNKEKSHQAGLPQAIGPISDYLLWHDQLQMTKCDTIVFVEGPFDALRTSILGAEEGICSTCFFTMQPSSQQIDLLHDLVERFKHRYLLLDKGTLPTALRLSGQLSSLDIRIRQLDLSTKDPGELKTTKALLSALRK